MYENKYQLFTSFKLNEWAGGTSTELFIYPQGANYQLRNFDFRISTATVEIEKSVFTSLPKYDRKLMILEGEIELVHDAQHSCRLKKFEIDEFSGSWQTHSIGKCIDFNVMTLPSYRSEINSLLLESASDYFFEIEAQWNWLFLYVYSGTIQVNSFNSDFLIQQEELLMVESKVFEKIKITPKTYCELVIVRVSLLPEKNL